jgi:uncharacterized membrane protein YbhN (UPF0104 family)
MVANAATATPERHFAWKRLLTGALVVLVIGALASLLGWDIKGWFHDVWTTVTSISAGYIVAGIAFKTVQTVAAAFAWYAILRFAYPGRVRWLDILACYAASVALNNVVPANLGTLVMLLMFTSIIAAATFAGILGAYAVEKIFYTVIGAFVYLYLFLSVGGSFDIKFEFVRTHPWATALFVLGGALLIYLLTRAVWPRVLKWWGEAKEGGSILVHPGAYFGRVFLPSLIGWVAGLGVTGVFLAAYGIPVSFEVLMRIVGGNSIANVVSVTPGGAGVNQAFNVASLKGVASSTDATAYSVAQQLVTTAWNILFGIVMLIWAFGWSGGKRLVRESYDDAKAKAAEQKAARRAKKEGEKAAVS